MHSLLRKILNPPRIWCQWSIENLHTAASKHILAHPSMSMFLKVVPRGEIETFLKGDYLSHLNLLLFAYFESLSPSSTRHLTFLKPSETSLLKPSETQIWFSPSQTQTWFFLCKLEFQKTQTWFFLRKLDDLKRKLAVFDINLSSKSRELYSFDANLNYTKRLTFGLLVFGFKLSAFPILWGTKAQTAVTNINLETNAWFEVISLALLVFPHVHL